VTVIKAFVTRFAQG